jgi:flagellar basal-body rod modification protein FlgD
MQVTAPVKTTNDQTAAAASSSSDKGKVDYDSFLQLLVAQLKSQDPLNPADPTQFVSQLATLSGLEQQIKQNDKLAQILTTMGIGEASGLLGRRVTSADGQVDGVVVAARSTTQGLIATLESGEELTIEQGVRVQI